MFFNRLNGKSQFKLFKELFNQLKWELIIFGFLILGVVLSGSTTIFCEYYPFSQGSPAVWTLNLLFFDMFIYMPVFYAGLIAVPFVPVALIASIFVKRIWRIRLIMLSVLFITAFLFQQVITKSKSSIRHAANEKVMIQGQIIIDAITAYEHEHSSYPQNLKALIPKYIDEIPGTGIKGFPYFLYEIINPSERKYRVPEMGDDPIYELRVNFYRVFKWDCFFYWPVERYPDYIYGGNVENLQKWAYVHE